MKDFKYYSETNVKLLPYDFVSKFIEEKMKEEVGTETQLKLKRKEFKVDGMSLRKNRRSEYDKAIRELGEEFKEDIFKEFRVEDNLKAEACFKIAWMYGHSAGLQEVYNYFLEIVELIK